MLAKKYRLVIDNQSQNSITAVTCSITPWKYDANGALEFQSAESQVWSGVPLGDNDQHIADDPIANEVTLALGAHGRISITTAGSGYSYIYLQQSEDGTNWADEYANPIATVSGSGTAEFEI